MPVKTQDCGANRFLDVLTQPPAKEGLKKNPTFQYAVQTSCSIVRHIKEAYCGHTVDNCVIRLPSQTGLDLGAKEVKNLGLIIQTA